MNNNKKQVEILLNLVRENPEMEILHLVRPDIMTKDWGYSKGTIEKVEKNHVCFFKNDYSVGMDDILDEISYYLCFGKIEINSELHEKECKKKVEELKQNGEISEKIIIFLK